ncbi:hypothetical protein ACHQM5_008854 [Ranunculus cassubicifolius]
MASVCPFATSVRRPDSDACPRNLVSRNQSMTQRKLRRKNTSLRNYPPYRLSALLDMILNTFKLGPLSCMICQALLFESSKCEPCSHKFCKECISRFKDCPLCGADIERIVPDDELQGTVDRFIEGHARIKRPQIDGGAKGVNSESKTIIYGDVSNAFRSHNILSAKLRLIICAEDIQEQIERQGSNSELCSQLGTVLGMLGDCWIIQEYQADFLHLINEPGKGAEGFTPKSEWFKTLCSPLGRVNPMAIHYGWFKAEKCYLPIYYPIGFTRPSGEHNVLNHSDFVVNLNNDHHTVSSSHRTRFSCCSGLVQLVKYIKLPITRAYSS